MMDRTHSKLWATQLSIITLGLLGAALSNCIITPDKFTMFARHRIFFVTGDSITGEYVWESSPMSVKLTLQGLFSVTNTSKGENRFLTLRVKCEKNRGDTTVTFDPAAISASYKDVRLAIGGVRPLDWLSNDDVVTYHVSLSDIRGQRTLSLVEQSPDFYEPQIEIDLSRFVSVDGVPVHIPPIVAYARNPEERKLQVR